MSWCVELVDDWNTNSEDLVYNVELADFWEVWLRRLGRYVVRCVGKLGGT